MAPDPFDLQRFVDAQSRMYDSVLAELRRGRKTSHWIWFIFPQLAGLGRSPTAQRFGIVSLAEAREYLRHDVLGPRLRECTQLLSRIDGRSVETILGYPDDLKVRSSMTLFARAAENAADKSIFTAVLDKYYGGEDDPATLDLLAGGPQD